MHIQLNHALSGKPVLLDATENWTLNENQSQQNNNEILKLLVYRDGLAFLYAGIRKEEASIQGFPLPAPTVPRIMFFEWYAITVCNYVALTASIAFDSGLITDEESRGSVISAYAGPILKNVKLFRDKVAAHTSRVAPRKEDNELDRVISVLPTMPLCDGRFTIGGYQIATSKMQSQHDISWALTKYHEEEFLTRYPSLRGSQ